MNKSQLLGAVCACVIASTNAAEGVVHNAGKYGSQDMLVHSIETGTNQAKRIRNDPLASGLLNTVFIISLVVTAVLLLRKSNKS